MLLPEAFEKPTVDQRKKTRDAEGSIFKKQVTRRTDNGKSRIETIYIVRVRYTDNDGKSREKKRTVADYNQAKIIRRTLRTEIEAELNGEVLQPADVRTFAELAAYFEQRYIREAAYSGNEKVGGFREDLDNIRRRVQVALEFFGDRPLASITYDDLADFKQARLATPVVVTKTKKKPQVTRPRSIASVNRDLGTVRRLFNIAVQRGWLPVSPFKSGDPLISKAAETKRVRSLTPGEESRLLAQCTGKREHLRNIIIIAIDTALRRNELFTLKWADIDLANRTIRVRARNTKTLNARMVPISARALTALHFMRDAANDIHATVFGIAKAERSFPSAVKAAGITDFTFHDLRGTGITRLLRAGLPPTEVMKISGHTTWETFMRYVKQDQPAMLEASQLLDQFNAQNKL